MDEQVHLLEQKIAAQEKTIRILSERLEQQTADNISGFALFEQNIVLENVVTTRTRELEAHRIELERALTELKAAQSELLQAQKLQAIGQLASGIAHEINTPTQYVGDNITFITESFADLLQALQLCESMLAETPDGESPPECRSTLARAMELADYHYLKEEIPRALKECKDGVKRISGIVGAMKEFAHPSGGIMQPVDLNHLIRSTVEICRNEWKLIAELETELDPVMSSVLGLKDELGQVLLNLIVNAAHAIADGKTAGDKMGLIRIATRCDGDWAEIQVQDNGCGVPMELRQKIFEPFFTTKEVGRGSGQGLAIVYHVVTDKHHGELTVDSAPGQGTIFTVRLPMAS
ncbi:sensor histidine kinase [Sedimenticola hydrogenitrophicus]|uniref:sensor histidine kinase n=1 Tax=Sedimenticola hydrogenitrophicus TaxID=2967975 RepID=UPI0023B0E291|nr:ATP-binding protein [Sedimenticola hydrogenitrophicus]